MDYNVLCCIFMIGSGNKHIIFVTCVELMNCKVACVCVCACACACLCECVCVCVCVRERERESLLINLK